MCIKNILFNKVLKHKLISSLLYAKIIKVDNYINDLKNQIEDLDEDIQDEEIKLLIAEYISLLTDEIIFYEIKLENYCKNYIKLFHLGKNNLNLL